MAEVALVFFFLSACVWPVDSTFYFEPGDTAPPFILPTLEGSFVYLPTSNSPPFVFYALDNRSAFAECLWTKDESLDHLIRNSTRDVHYFFMSFSDHAQQDVEWMQLRMRNRMTTLEESRTVGAGTANDLFKRSHFVTVSANDTDTWISSLLSNWTCQDHGCGINQIEAVAEKGLVPSPIRRLDARYDWLFGRYENGGKFPLVDFKDGCTSTSATYTGHVALISRSGPRNCTFYTKVLNAFKSNVSGVIVFSTPDDPLVDMNCAGAECGSLFPIPGTMISYEDGTALQQALEAGWVNVTFQTLPAPVFYFGIDGQGKVQQTGWLLYPSFLFLIWQSQWYNYWTGLLTQLDHSATVIPVLNHSTMQGQYGASAVVHVPSMQELWQYELIELDMALSCPGSEDDSCAAWDHTIQLFICCNPLGDYCGQELGRWITPFRRRIGRWLTNITPLLPFFDGPSCNLTMKTVPWAKPWDPSLNIRLSGRADPGNVVIRPYKVIPLFKGGTTTFNSSYNKQFVPVVFSVDDYAVKVVLEAVITGHGSDNNNCGEFCVTSHRFTVNRKHTNVETFSNPTNPLGCAMRVSEGVEPNEHGTWLYGRDGWCDGQEVSPWVVDITHQVHIGEMNDVSYVGWFNGTDPHPTRKPGYIIMYSNIVFYEKVHV
eukprot:m.308403 g.308403  ORF g.308403 m.308403 type:complete len:657 (+) comp43948_c0_seq1:423-2393(+)